jgi:3-methyl-2-oxobutanoate hydroxymethyltransferase
MSLTPIGFRRPDGTGQKITTASLRERKFRHEPITCITAYDYSAARLVDEAGVEMVLVGDSLAQTMPRAS